MSCSPSVPLTILQILSPLTQLQPQSEDLVTPGMTPAGTGNGARAYRQLMDDLCEREPKSMPHPGYPEVSDRRTH